MAMLALSAMSPWHTSMAGVSRGVAGVALESKAQNCNPLAGHRVEHGRHDDLPTKVSSTERAWYGCAKAQRML